MQGKLIRARQDRLPTHAPAVNVVLVVATAMLLGVLFFADLSVHSSLAHVALSIVGAVAALGALYALVQRWHRDLARTATLAERRRVARELHDGLAQELAYIGMESERLGEQGLDALRQAAHRALDESRTLIGALRRANDESLQRALERTAEELAHRTGADVQLDVSAPVRLERGVCMSPPAGTVRARRFWRRAAQRACALRRFARRLTAK